MIPAAEELIAGWAFVARRRGLSGEVDPVAVAEGVALARTCAAGSERDEPAALFFALARHPKAFGDGWRRASETFPAGHAAALGLTLDASPIELADRRIAAYSGRAAFEDVRRWFALRLRPRSP